ISIDFKRDESAGNNSNNVEKFYMKNRKSIDDYLTSTLQINNLGKDSLISVSVSHHSDKGFKEPLFFIINEFDGENCILSWSNCQEIDWSGSIARKRLSID